MTRTDLTPQFNEWPNELAKEVMENTELEHAAWSPTERCNFCAHLAATRVSVNIFEFEMAPTFRTALPAFFFSWWLYMTEVTFFSKYSFTEGNMLGSNFFFDFFSKYSFTSVR